MKQLPLILQTFNALGKDKWHFILTATPAGHAILYHVQITTGTIGFTAETPDLKKSIDSICTKAYHANVIPYDKYSEILTGLHQH